jgi:hypothetical protein
VSVLRADDRGLMTEVRRWEVEKMRRWERLAAAKRKTNQRLPIIREQAADDAWQFINNGNIPFFRLQHSAFPLRIIPTFEL